MLKKLKAVISYLTLIFYIISCSSLSFAATSLEIINVHNMYAQDVSEDIVLTAHLPYRDCAPALYLDDTKLTTVHMPSAFEYEDKFIIRGSYPDGFNPTLGRHKLSLVADGMVSTSYIYIGDYANKAEKKDIKHSSLYAYYAFDQKGDMYFTPHTGIVEIADSTLHISGTADVGKNPLCEIFLPAEMYTADNFVIDMDVTLIDNSEIINLISLMDRDGNITGGISFTSDSLYINGKWICRIEKNIKHNIAIAFDYTDNTYTAYVDNVIYRTKMVFSDKFKRPHILRTLIEANNIGERAEYYIDNLKLYSGDRKAEFTASELEAAAVFAPIGESESQAKKLISTSSVFMSDTSDSYYMDGKKQSYLNDGYEVYVSSSSELMLPESLLENALNARITVNDKGVSLNYQNIDADYEKAGNSYYLSLEDTAGAAKGIYLYKDDRGMYIVDTKPIAYTNSELAANISEDIDIIYRYMFFERPDGGEILKALNSKNISHPRIIASCDDIAETKQLIDTNDDFKLYLANSEKIADSYIAASVVTPDFSKKGSFLGEARTLMHRIRNLGVMYQVTGESKYSDAVWREMSNALSWQTWNENTTNFLDTSEIAYGIILGYDFIYDKLSSSQKQQVVNTVFDRFLTPIANAYRGKHPRCDWVSGSITNWSFVCSGSAISACLALADEVSDEKLEQIEFILSNAPKSIETALMGFYPDGAWHEGPGYWQYSVMYLYGAILAPLRNCCDTAFGLDMAPGVCDTLKFTLSHQGPSGQGFNFGDTADDFREKDGTGYLIAKLTGDDAAMQSWHELILNNGNKGDDKTLIWYRPTNGTALKLPLDNYFKGSDIGTMRSSYSDKFSSYVAVKGGYTGVNSHSHLDSGNFVFDSQGVRWAEEMGFDDYEAKGANYWTEHYKFYRTRPEGQNVLVINPRADDASKGYWGGQLIHRYAPLIDFKPGEDSSVVSFDLSDVYSEDTLSYTRSFTLGDDKTNLVIKDELDLKLPNSDIYWFMHTKADIILSADKKTAILTIGDKKLKVEAVSDAAEYAFEIREPKPFDTSPQISDQLSGDYEPVGIKKLTLKLKGSGKLNIEVKLSNMN